MTVNAFAKIAAATATGGGNNIRDGVYKFLVESVKLQSGHTGTSFIAEFRVVEATSNGAADEHGRAVIPNAVGSTCSMVANLTKHESAAGNAKAFVENAMAGIGYSPAQINEEMMAIICSDKNPLRGLMVIDETYRGVNKGRSNPANAGKPLTLNKWKAVPQTGEDLAKQKAYLDSTTATADAAQPAAPASAPMVPAAQVTAPVVAAAPAPSTGGNPGGLLGSILGGGK